MAMNQPTHPRVLSGPGILNAQITMNGLGNAVGGYYYDLATRIVALEAHLDRIDAVLARIEQALHPGARPTVAGTIMASHGGLR